MVFCEGRRAVLARGRRCSVVVRRSRGARRRVPRWSSRGDRKWRRSRRWARRGHRSRGPVVDATVSRTGAAPAFRRCSVLTVNIARTGRLCRTCLRIGAGRGCVSDRGRGPVIDPAVSRASAAPPLGTRPVLADDRGRCGRCDRRCLSKGSRHKREHEDNHEKQHAGVHGRHLAREVRLAQLRPTTLSTRLGGAAGLGDHHVLAHWSVFNNDSRRANRTPRPAWYCRRRAFTQSSTRSLLEQWRPRQLARMSVRRVGRDVLLGPTRCPGRPLRGCGGGLQQLAHQSTFKQSVRRRAAENPFRSPRSSARLAGRSDRDDW